jgi:hypothetical protein
MLASALPGGVTFSSFPDTLVQRTLYTEARFVQDLGVTRKSFATRFQLSGSSDK